MAVTAFGVTTAVSYMLSGLVDWRIAILLVADGIGGALLAQRLSGSKSMLTRVFASIVPIVGVHVVVRVSRGRLWLIGRR